MSAKSPVFDAPTFVKHVKNSGRVYRNQAMSLISICQILIRAQEQTFRSYDELRRVLQVVDDALQAAAETRNKKSKEADEKFKKAIDALGDYEKTWHSRETVAEKMAVAKAKDKSSLTILNKIKQKLRPPVQVPMRTVEFHIHKSLPDRNPTIVKMVLSKHPSLSEVLWIFGRFEDERRLTLKQNPHFYEVLPTSPEKYGGTFRVNPIETFQHQKISVLIDNPGPTGQVFLETEKGTRAFGNAWVPKDVIVFKDVCGSLEGEGIVGAAFQDTPKLWCIEEPPLYLYRASQSALSLNRSSPSINTTRIQIPSVATTLQGDWREPVRRMLRSLDLNICITAKPPGTFAYSTNPSPIAPVAGRNDGPSLADSRSLAPHFL